MFIALFVGYIIGARSGTKELDQLVESWQALRETDEFAAVLSAARAHLAHTLRDLADMVDGGRTPPVESADLVDQVRHLVGSR
jgi:hypothetical protein